MKKVFLLGAAALFLLVSCAGKGEAGKTNEDNTAAFNSETADTALGITDMTSDNPTDSISGPTTESEPEPVDDSFAKSIPNPKKIFWDENCGKYLKSLGFSGSSRTVMGEYEEMTTGNYSLENGNKSCTVKFECGSNYAEMRVTINGDKAALDAFYKKAKKMAGSGYEWYTEVKKSGNTVKIEGAGA